MQGKFAITRLHTNMKFKQWLLEWEGNAFAQEKDLVNGPQYPNSKYKGKGDNEEGNRANLGGEFDKISKDYGLKPDDPLLKLQKLMRKMRKMMVK